MTRTRCLHCPESHTCRDSRASLFFFFIGMIATIAIRGVIVAQHFDPVYGKISWYIGVGGFLVYFIYKFIVEQRRTRVIKQEGLLQKVQEGTPLQDKDRAVLSAVLCSLSGSKDIINYFLIFFTSAIALLLALYFDMKG